MSAWLKLSVKTLLVSVVLSPLALAANNGALTISVIDEDGNAVAGASVTARTPDSLTQKTGTTDENGSLRLMGLDPSEDYVITVVAEGYGPQRNENVLVISDRTLSVPFIMFPAEGEMEEIVTIGRSGLGQLVDTSSSVVSTDVTLDFIESLPTGRTYQSYLQAAPTTKPALDGNPSSKSGLNYSDIVDSNGNTAGKSSDNVYYIDGINITDNLTGTFGANFNSEIIQEMQIITGGVPAEYEGGQGLISRVISKSGGNEWHGTVNYYTQSDSLVADNKHLEDSSFSTYDTAFTIGGPIIRDKLWVFASMQRKEREEDVIDPVTDTVLRTVTRTEDLGFAKVTWQPTENDKFVGLFFNDPTDLDGSFNTATTTNRDRATKQGGDNYKFAYTRFWNNLTATLDYVSHEGELSRVAADASTLNDVAYTTDVPGITNTDTEQGGYGQNIIDFRNKESINLTFEYFLDTSFGSHEIKFGYSDVTNERNLNLVYTGDGAQYTSLGAENAGLLLDEYTGASGGLTFTGIRDFSEDDYGRVLTAIDASPDRDYFVGLLDTDNSGDVSAAELGAYQLTSTAGNPTGEVNVYRIVQSQQGPTDYETDGSVFFLQDSWKINDHWTVNAGVRAEKWSHYNTAGDKIFTFDYEYAPRFSVVYDIRGDGRSKVWAYTGRYYDPIRTNMTAFAGTVTGSVRDEQFFLGDRWLTFRTRGGPGDPDGFFAPSTKTPYTNEVMLGYETSLTENISLTLTYTDRETKDILEDYDLNFYTDCSADGVGGYCLPLSYFGFEELPAANYFIATLAGGKREYEGFEVVLRKRRSADSNWFGLFSYVYNDANGNSNSDSNADLQGDFLYLDPRAPNVYGPQPGNVEHLVKLGGSYAWDNGFEVGAVYGWNSGTVYSETFAQYGRHTQIRVGDAYEDNGVTTRWLAENTVGSQTTPSYGTLDLRAKYTWEFGASYSAEFFLDVFNVLDDQSVRRQQDLSGGDGVYDFGEANAWVEPRRFYLGARFNF
jgi:hypothetical protein